MAIFVGSNQINDIMIGTNQINEVYVGSNLVWSRTYFLPETGWNNYSNSSTTNLGSNITTSVTMTRDATLKVEVTGTVDNNAHFSLEKKTDSSSNWPSAGTSYSTKWSSGSYTNNAKTLACVENNVLRFNGFLVTDGSDIDVTVVIKDNSNNQVLDTFTYYVKDILGSSTGGSCFLGDSLVTLSDLTTKRIPEVLAGDLVLGDDGVINEVVELRTIDIGDKVIFSINHLKTTSGHPIKTTEGWKALDSAYAISIHPELDITDLRLGDTLICVDSFGNEYQEEVTSITSEVVTDILYNLNVSGSDTPDIAGNDTYIVDGVVVHNK